MTAATVAIIGNSWAFARRIQFRVKGQPLKEKDPPLKEKDPPLKEQDRQLKVKGRHTVFVFKDFFIVGSFFRSEA